MLRFFSSLLISACLTFGFASFAAAQNVDPKPLDLAPLDNWKIEKCETSDSCVQVYVNPDTESRIEVYKRELVRGRVAEQLFTTFHDKLVQNGFSVVKEDLDHNMPLKNNAFRPGYRYEYEYAAEVPLYVTVFDFYVTDKGKTIAYIFVEYCDKMIKDAAIQDFNTLITNSLTYTE